MRHIRYGWRLPASIVNGGIVIKHPEAQSPQVAKVKSRILDVFDELLRHDGFGEFHVEFRILKRQQKEIIIHCGKQYRYVVDHRNPGREGPALAETQEQAKRVR